MGRLELILASALGMKAGKRSAGRQTLGGRGVVPSTYGYKWVIRDGFWTLPR